MDNGLNGFWGWVRRALTNTGNFLQGKGLIAGLIGDVLLLLWPELRTAQQELPAHIVAALDRWNEDQFKPLLETYTAWLDTNDIGDFRRPEYSAKYNTVLKLFATLKAYYESKHRFQTGLDFQLWEQQMMMCAGVLSSFEEVYLRNVGANPPTMLELQEFDPSIYQEVGDIPLDWSHVTTITATANQIVSFRAESNQGQTTGQLPKPLDPVFIDPLPKPTVPIIIGTIPQEQSGGGIVIQSPPFNPNITLVDPPVETDPIPVKKTNKLVPIAIAVGVFLAVASSGGGDKPKKK